ncbi:MAG: hypothetical protein Q7P63_17725 [Verrucomicrobiota bacterium JB022]|nr:hypothetical protein [Verrucomicrobiota bacterium JB022]
MPLRLFALGLLALLPPALHGQASNRVVIDPAASSKLDINVGPNPDARELAKSWTQVLDSLDLRNNVRLTVVRGDTQLHYMSVIKLEPVEHLLVVTLGTGGSRSGRHRVVVRADEVLALAETPGE